MTRIQHKITEFDPEVDLSSKVMMHTLLQWKAEETSPEAMGADVKANEIMIMIMCIPNLI